jgi:uncharacterized protein Smg (DUF494 family)
MSARFGTDKSTEHHYLSSMSFTEVLNELSTLTFEQRQMLIRRALEIDDSPLSPEDESVVDSRLSAMRESPDSAVPLDEMKRRLRSRFS